MSCALARCAGSVCAFRRTELAGEDWMPDRQEPVADNAGREAMPSGNNNPSDDRLEEKLWWILRISQKINSERDLRVLLDLIAREATRLLEADRASIFLLDSEKGELWSQLALHENEPIRFD